LRAHALAEALLDEAAQVRQGPARRLAFLRVGTAQDAVDQDSLLPLGETLRSTTVRAVHPSCQSLRVEAQNSVTERLPLDPGRSRRIGPAHAFKRIGQRQHALRGSAAWLLFGQPPQLRRTRHVRSDRQPSRRHGRLLNKRQHGIRLKAAGKP
jgi:hypothetical protein